MPDPTSDENQVNWSPTESPDGASDEIVQSEPMADDPFAPQTKRRRFRLKNEPEEPQRIRGIKAGEALCEPEYPDTSTLPTGVRRLGSYVKPKYEPISRTVVIATWVFIFIPSMVGGLFLIWFGFRLHWLMVVLGLIALSTPLWYFEMARLNTGFWYGGDYTDDDLNAYLMYRIFRRIFRRW